MSFATQPINLSGRIPPAHKFKHCDGCDKDRAPEGGIELSPGKWRCYSCWTRRTVSGTKKPKQGVMA